MIINATMPICLSRLLKTMSMRPVDHLKIAGHNVGINDAQFLSTVPKVDAYEIVLSKCQKASASQGALTFVGISRATKCVHPN